MIAGRLTRLLGRFSGIPQRLGRIQEALGRIESRQLSQWRGNPRAAEFRVFSQWGEDGIIQNLIARVPIDRPLFIEFGVENYLEANTRFLLTNNHWSGLVIDGSAENIGFIRRDSIYWACNLKAEHAFITRENIDRLITDNGMAGDIGLLSIDIDGNDYWVWEAIESVSPRIVVCEYNSHFGVDAEITIPYDAQFVRASAHHSRIYYGASISALRSLGERKGYKLVAANSAGNNLFFVREDLLGSLAVLSAAEAYCQARFREYHDPAGNLTYDDFETRVRKLAALPVYDIKQGGIRLLGSIDTAPATAGPCDQRAE